MTGEQKKPPKGTFICKTCNVYVPLGCEDKHKTGKKHLFLEEVQRKHTTKATRSIYVKNMPSGISDLELTDYFSKFGPVSSVYFPKSKAYAFVEFSCSVSDLEVLKGKHSLRGQELVVNHAIPSARNKDHSFHTPPVDITKGHLVVGRIKENVSLDSQVKSFLTFIQLTEEELLTRGDFVASLTSSLQEFFPGSRLEIFGSTANGLGFTGCDIDLSFFLPFERSESQTLTLEKADVPTPYDVFSGKFAVENLMYLSRENLLIFLSKFISHLPGFKFARCIPSARCPIVKFHHRGVNLCGDISFSKSLGLANTHLLRLYGQLHFKIYALLMILRFWGKREQLVGSNHLITSYAFSWLVIFYLQKIDVVPTVETLASLSEINLEAESWNCTFCEDLNVIPVKIRDRTFCDLITGFFEFYTKFDFTVHIICPRDGTAAVKKELFAEAGDELDFKITSMSVQDVFDLTHNITGSVNDTTIQSFLSKCSEQHAVWSNMAREKNVNLKCMFDPAAYQVVTIPSDSENHSLYITLLSEKTGGTYEVHKVCNFVLDVLRKAFLFECNVTKSAPEFAIHSSPPTVRSSEGRPKKKLKLSTDDEHFILNVTCKVVYRTWVGRKNVKGFISRNSSVSQMEVEEYIANEVAKNSEKKTGQHLYVFETVFLLHPESHQLQIIFIPKIQKNELIFTVIPYVKKHIITMAESSLDSYITETKY